MTPSGSDDVTITLAGTTDCAAAGAICTDDGRALSSAVVTTVPHTAQPVEPPAPVAFEVRFEDIADEHDGTNAIVFKVMFNKRPKSSYGYETMRDSTIKVQQGDQSFGASYVRRLNRPHNDEWEVTVTPVSKTDLTVSVGPAASCSATGAVCTESDEALSNTATKTVLGPPSLSVADARVEEAADATLDFEVTMSRASVSTVTVDYATSDGTGSNGAVAGVDYTAASGTLTFAPGEMAKTVSVAVFEDTHDEGEETLTFTLSNPSGGNAWLEDATATGIIENSDPMPRAWMVRFGRTVGTHVVDALGMRLDSSAQSHVTIADVNMMGGDRTTRSKRRSKIHTGCPSGRSRRGRTPSRPSPGTSCCCAATSTSPQVGGTPEHPPSPRGDVWHGAGSKPRSTTSPWTAT